jgi:hypothetical protein
MALTCYDQGLLRLARSESVRQLVLQEKDFGWLGVWELNPGV